MGLFDPLTDDQAQAVDPTTGLTGAQMRQMQYNTLGSVGAQLLAAGQKIMPSQRAQILSGLGDAAMNPQAMMLQMQQRLLQNNALARQNAAAVNLTKAFQSPDMQKEIATWSPQYAALAKAAVESGNPQILTDLFEKMSPKVTENGVYDPKTGTLSSPYYGTMQIGGGIPQPTAPVVGGAAPVAGNTNAAAPSTAAQSPVQGGFASLADIPDNLKGDDYLAAAGSINPQMNQMALAAKRVIQGYDPMPTPGRGVPAQYILGIQQMVKRADPTYDFTDPQARTKTRASFATGPNADAVQNVNTALHHGSELYGLNGQRYATSVPLANEVANAVVDNVAGGTKMATVNAAFDDTADKYAGETDKFISGGNPTISGRQTQRAPYDLAKAPSQVNSALKADATLMLEKMKPLVDKWKNGMGPNTGNAPPPMLDAQSVNYLNSLGLGDKIKELGIPVQQGAQPVSAAQSGTPQVGEVRKGYRFKGGNPADKNSWESVQ
jgi:hypothetical protein